MSQEYGENLPEKTGTKLPAQPGEPSPTQIVLRDGRVLSLAGLPEDKRIELQSQYLSGQIESEKKLADLVADVGALEKAMDTMAVNTAQVGKDGNTVTISHTQTSSAGRTEILMGNSEQATSGKFTKSQTGERDWKPYYIFGGIIAGALVVIALAGNLGG